MTGVIYARYSPGPNQTEQSIEGQFRECNQFAVENDITVVNTYADRKQTGRNDNREQFQKMLHDSKRHVFDNVIVWKIDRFGRNREEIAKNKAILRMNGVRVLFAREHIPEGPEGIILESVLEGLAEYYSANLSQNIIRGMRDSALKCQFNGSGLALGYSIDKDHKYHLDPSGAAVVQTIFKMYDSGSRIVDIRNYLNNSGIKTLRGKQFAHFGVTRILSNRQYIGEYRWHDIVIPGGLPQIIDEPLFESVQKRLDLNKKAPSAGRGEVNFLLTGKLFCGLCKDTMTGCTGTGKSGNKFHYYTCHNRRTKHNCNKSSVKQEWIEREITRLTASFVLQDDVIEYIADMVVAVQQKEQNDKSMLHYYNDHLKQTNAAIKNIMKAIEAGIFTSTTQNRLIELEEERNNIEIEITREKITRIVISREQVIYYLNKFKNGDINDKEYQERVIDTFVNKVVLYDDKVIITYNYSGDKNEVTADIIEEAAYESADNHGIGCSSDVMSTPPILIKANTTLFFVGHLFGIMCSIEKREG